MAIVYGALIGTPKNTVPATSIPATYENGKDQILARDRYEAAALAVADKIELVRNLPWETVLDPDECRIWFDDLGAAQTLTIGDTTYPAALAAAIDTGTAAGSANMMVSVDIANYFKPLWQVLGHANLAAARAVSGACSLYATVAGNAATGTLAWQMKGQRR